MSSLNINKFGKTQKTRIITIDSLHLYFYQFYLFIFQFLKFLFVFSLFLFHILVFTHFSFYFNSHIFLTIFSFFILKFFYTFFNNYPFLCQFSLNFLDFTIIFFEFQLKFLIEGQNPIMCIEFMLQTNLFILFIIQILQFSLVKNMGSLCMSPDKKNSQLPSQYDSQELNFKLQDKRKNFEISVIEEEEEEESQHNNKQKQNNNRQVEQQFRESRQKNNVVPYKAPLKQQRPNIGTNYLTNGYRRQSTGLSTVTETNESKYSSSNIQSSQQYRNTQQRIQSQFMPDPKIYETQIKTKNNSDLLAIR